MSPARRGGPGATRRMYDAATGWIHTRWVGGLQGAFVVRSTHLRHAVRRLPVGPPRRFLDAACGEHAALAAVLARGRPRDTFVAADLFVEPPPDGPPNLLGLVRDLERRWPDWDGAFDVVYALDVLEHVEAPAAVVESFHRWLKPGGLLLIHTPALAARHFFDGAAEAEHPHHRPVRKGDLHLRDGFAPEGLAAILTRAGFAGVSWRFTFHPRLWFVKELFTLGERRGIAGIGVVLLPILLGLARWEILRPPARGNGVWMECVRRP